MILGSPRAEAPLEAERVTLLLDVVLLLLPLHAEGRIGEHVVERRGPPAAAARVAIPGEAVAEDDVLGVLALDQHVRPAHRPRLVVPRPARRGCGSRLAVVLAQVVLGDSESMPPVPHAGS